MGQSAKGLVIWCQGFGIWCHAALSLLTAKITLCIMKKTQKASEENDKK